VRTVVVLDYGSGNIRSAQRAVARAGADVTVTTDARLATGADGLVVPGVGAFAACMAGLVAVGGPEIIAARRTSGRPTLAICVGHQVLFEAGIEHGVRTEGCGIWPGLVEQLHAARLHCLIIAPKIIRVQEQEDTTARLIANPVAHKLKAGQIDAIVERVRAG